MEEFFSSIHLNIKLNWNIITRARDIFKPLLHINTSKLSFNEELMNSFEIENASLNQNIIKNLLSYDGIGIQKIHQIMTECKKPFKRNKYVYVLNAFGDILHVGLQSSKIDYDLLQQWVNTYYEHKFSSPIEKTFCGFLLYVMYIRIHPHEDGNGRTARYLFLENKLLEGTENYFPLSSILASSSFEYVNDVISKIYKLIDITEKGVSEEVYYTLVLSDAYVKRILYIIYSTMLYKYLYVSDTENTLKYAEYESFSEMLFKYHSLFAGATFLEEDAKIVKDIKNFISKWVDLDKHVKVLKVLHV